MLYHVDCIPERHLLSHSHFPACQVFRVRELQKERHIAYDYENSEHEIMLFNLWKKVYPEEELEGRVSKQWEKMGFQGKDPATDLRGMGILGLKHLTYFSLNHTEKFVDITRRQHERDDGRFYPSAVAFINVSNMLFSLLTPSDVQVAEVLVTPSAPDVHKMAILFSHPSAIEEMYCTTCEVLDRMWEEMQASYMDFGKVIKRVTQQIEDVLKSKPMTIENFRKAAFMLSHSVQSSFLTRAGKMSEVSVSLSVAPVLLLAVGVPSTVLVRPCRYR
jgi:ELMO/CED-12 family protein